MANSFQNFIDSLGGADKALEAAKKAGMQESAINKYKELYYGNQPSSENKSQPTSASAGAPSSATKTVINELPLSMQKTQPSRSATDTTAKQTVTAASAGAPSSTTKAVINAVPLSMQQKSPITGAPINQPATTSSAPNTYKVDTIAGYDLLNRLDKGEKNVQTSNGWTWTKNSNGGYTATNKSGVSMPIEVVNRPQTQAVNTAALGFDNNIDYDKYLSQWANEIRNGDLTNLSNFYDYTTARNKKIDYLNATGTNKYGAVYNDYGILKNGAVAVPTSVWSYKQDKNGDITWNETSGEIVYDPSGKGTYRYADGSELQNGDVIKDKYGYFQYYDADEGVFIDRDSWLEKYTSEPELSQMSQEELIEYLYDTYFDTGGEEINLDPFMTWAEASAIAGERYNPIYNQSLNKSLDNINKAALASGFYGQLPTEALKQQAAASADAERTAAINELAESLMMDDRDTALAKFNALLNAKQLNMDDVLELINVAAAYNTEGGTFDANGNPIGTTGMMNGGTTITFPDGTRMGGNSGNGTNPNALSTETYKVDTANGYALLDRLDNGEKSVQTSNGWTWTKNADGSYTATNANGVSMPIETVGRPSSPEAAAADTSAAGNTGSTPKAPKKKKAATGSETKEPATASLSKEDIAALQRELGVTSDGIWGAQSRAAAGGLSAEDAMKKYGTTSKMDDTSYNSYVKRITDNIDKGDYASAKGLYESRTYDTMSLVQQQKLDDLLLNTYGKDVLTKVLTGADINNNTPIGGGAKKNNSTNSSGTFTYTQPTGYGAKGDRVKNIQTALVALGYLAKNAVDGIFGSTTAAAVRRFQKDNGLTQDGYVGTDTGKALEAAQRKFVSSGGGGGALGDK